MALVGKSVRSGEPLFNGVVTVGASSVQVRPQNRKRVNLKLTNDSTKNIYLSFGEVVAEAHKGYRLAAAGVLVEDEWLGEVRAIGEEAGQALCVVEV